MSNRVTTLLGGYNLGTPGTAGYRGKIRLMMIGLLSQLAFSVTTQAYVTVDRTNGSATGGGGAGTFASPYRVRHCADWATLWGNIKGSGSIEVLFKRGDILRANPAASVSAAQGFSTGVANVKLGTYGSANDPPFEFTGFVPLSSSFTFDTALTTSDGQLYSCVFETTSPAQKIPKWVRVGATLALQLETVYSRVASEVAMPARSWYYKSATKTLYINRDAAKTDDVLNTAEVQVTTGIGITLTNHDLQKITGINSTGWGMDTDTSSNYCFLSQCQGSTLHQFDDCGAWWGPQHVMGALASGVGETGGCCLATNCKFGLGIMGGSGMTSYVHYAHTGDQESILINCTATHGALRTNVYSTQYNGIPWYYHTSGDGTPFAFVFRQNCTALSRTDHMFSVYGVASNGPAVTDQADLSQYRIWIDGETADWTLGDVDGAIEFGGATTKAAQYHRCSWRFSTTVASGLRTGSTGDWNGQMRRCRLRIVRSWAGQNMNICGGVTSAIDLIGCAFELTTGGNDTYLFGTATNVRAFRCVFQSNAANFYHGITNGANGTSNPYTGGGSDCAYYGTAGTFASQTRPLTLTAAANFDQGAYSARFSDTIRAISTGWPGTEVAGADINLKTPRYAARSTIGPMEDCRNYRKRVERYAVA